MSIAVSGLTKIYGKQKAIDQVSFSVKKGEIVGFLGPNGAGKSTTMKILSGFLKPTSGFAKICDFDVDKYPMEVKKRIGYLPENNPLYSDLYVKEMLYFSAGLYKVPGKRKKIAALIDRVGLAGECNKKIGALSKGYRQRVGLARVLLHDPEVLILDEPTSGLDPNQLAEIRGLILSLSGEKTVLFSTHILQEVKALCQRAIIISHGQIVADNSLQQLEYRKGESALTVEFDAPVHPGLMENLSHVKEIRPQAPGIWIISTENPEALKKSLWQLALENNLNIVSLQSSKVSLEEIFKKLTN